jgi:hypothetical protein
LRSLLRQSLSRLRNRDGSRSLASDVGDPECGVIDLATLAHSVLRPIEVADDARAK